MGVECVVVPPDGPVPAGRKTYRVMSFKAALGLLVIALCAAGNVWLLQAQVETQASDAVQINISGRQRMLSQRLGTQLLQIATASDPETLAANRAALLQTMTELGQANRALTQGDDTRGIFFKPSQGLNDHYWGQGTGLAPRVDALMGQAAMFTFKKPDLEDPHFQELIQDIQGPILEDLDHAVALYEQESIARVAHLGELQVKLTGVLILFLVLEFFLIFHPMARSVGREMAHVVRAKRAAEEQKRSLALVLDSMQDALIPVDAAGRVLPGCSARAKALFPELAEGAVYWKAFGAEPALSDRLAMDFEQLQDGLLPVELLMDQMCESLVWQSRHLRLGLRQIIEPGHELGYLLTLRDVSAQVCAQAEFDLAQERADVLSHYGQNPRRFVQSIDELERLLGGVAQERALLVDRLRDLHTVKGNAAVLGFQRLSHACHELEQALNLEPDLDLAQEVRQVRERWREQVGEILPAAKEFSIQVPEAALRSLAQNLREKCPEMVPQVEGWFGDSVRAHLEDLAAHGQHLASNLGKELEVQVECPPNLHIPHEHSTRIWTQLVHLVRNAVDHGIESPEQRQAAGKQARGVLRFCANEVDGVLSIRVEDDGGGVDWAALRARGASMGLTGTSPEDLLFADGLSCKDQATEISGRGIGAGALREAVREVGGTLRVTSERGLGTRIVVRWPHTPHGLVALAS